MCKFANTQDLNLDIVYLFGKEVLFTFDRVGASSVPTGLYKYDIRHSPDNAMKEEEITDFAYSNHYGTVLSCEKLIPDGAMNRKIQEDMIYTDHTVSLAWYCEKHRSEIIYQLLSEHHLVDAGKEADIEYIR